MGPGSVCGVVDSLEERVRRAAERADRPQASSWTPNKPGAGHPVEIAGEVVERAVKQNVGFENKQTVAIVTVRQVDGAEWAVWCFGKVLADDLAAAPIGAVVFVRYDGLSPDGGKGGKGYERYRVVVDAGDQVAEPVAAAAPPPIEVEPEPVAPAPPPVEVCGACGGDGRHLPGCPERASEKCDECQFVGGHHRDGCSSDIPF